MSPSKEDRDAVKKRFYDAGVAIVDWAKENDFDVNLVYGVLSGRSRALRGESHEIAIALGLKKGAKQSPKRN